MDARTEHLVALVKDGARLADAASVYGISAERVRQLLKQAGMSARELPGRGEKPRTGGSRRARELAGVIEAMWREGMLYHEIAEVIDIACVPVHRVVCERVPESERAAHIARRLHDGRACGARLLGGMRKAAAVLSEASAIEAAERRRAQAVVEGWLAAHSQLSTAADAGSPSKPTPSADAASPAEPLTAAELQGELDRFKARLGAGGLSRSTISAYLLGSSLFVRWLAGDYVPRGRRSVGPTDVAPEVPS
jgi:hypothetical protein